MTPDALNTLAGILEPALAPAGASLPVRLEPATIQAVDATGAEDGGPLLTITWRDVQVDAAHLAPPAAYSGTDVGDVVLVAVVGATPVVLGVIQGQPPEPDTSGE